MSPRAGWSIASPIRRCCWASHPSRVRSRCSSSSGLWRRHLRPFRPPAQLLVTQSLACVQSAALAILDSHPLDPGVGNRMPGAVPGLRQCLRRADPPGHDGGDGGQGGSAPRHLAQFHDVQSGAGGGAEHRGHPDRAGGRRHLFFDRCVFLWRGDPEPFADAFRAAAATEARRALPRRARTASLCLAYAGDPRLA